MTDLLLERHDTTLHHTTMHHTTGTDTTMNDTMNDTTMNDSTMNGTGATADADALRRAKVAALQRRRGSTDTGETAQRAAVSSPSVRGGTRAGVAQGSKIAATAIGMTAMFGIVAGMTIAAQRKTNSAPAVTPAPAQVVVVIHPAASSAAAVAPAAGPTTAGQPIVLSAQPTVRQAASAGAPVAKTNGSH